MVKHYCRLLISLVYIGFFIFISCGSPKRSLARGSNICLDHSGISCISDCVLLKEYYVGAWGDIVLFPTVEEMHLETHPNNVNGDCIILYPGTGSEHFYSEHIAEYAYDEFGIWYTTIYDLLVFKPIAYSKWDTGNIIISLLENAKEKVFSFEGDYIYEITKYKRGRKPDQYVLYDTSPADYLHYRDSISIFGFSEPYQRVFKILNNRNVLPAGLETSNQVRPLPRYYPMDVREPNNYLFVDTNGNSYLVLSFPMDTTSGLNTYIMHFADKNYDEYGSWTFSKNSLVLCPSLSIESSNTNSPIISILGSNGIVHDRHFILTEEGYLEGNESDGKRIMYISQELLVPDLRPKPRRYRSRADNVPLNIPLVKQKKGQQLFSDSIMDILTQTLEVESPEKP